MHRCRDVHIDVGEGRTLTLAPGDRLICKPGTYFELEPVTVNGRQYRMWKNVSLPRQRR